MKDRQFMIVLALVIAAGLVMGLVAFRMTGGTAPAPASAAASNAPAPSPADADTASADQPSDSVPQSDETRTQNGEPAAPTKEPPPMQGAGNGDPPGTAATPTAPAVPGDTPADTPQ